MAGHDFSCYQNVRTSKICVESPLMDFDKLNDLSYERACLLDLLMTPLPAKQRRAVKKRLSTLLDEMRKMLREADSELDAVERQASSVRQRRRQPSDPQNGQAVA